MTRIALTDGTGRWFNMETAEKFAESTYWNGNNHISKATGSQWVHEALYRTKGGRWILHHWSNYQGGRDSYEEIDNAAAARWLVQNDEEPHPACTEEYQALEIA